MKLNISLSHKQYLAFRRSAFNGKRWFLTRLGPNLLQKVFLSNSELRRRAMLLYQDIWISYFCRGTANLAISLQNYYTTLWSWPNTKQIVSLQINWTIWINCCRLLGRCWSSSCPSNHHPWMEKEYGRRSGRDTLAPQADIKNSHLFGALLSFPDLSEC